MREFDIGGLVLVRKQANSNIKDGMSQRLVFKTKGLYRVLEKDTPSSYWLQSLTFCEGLGMPGRKLKESVARMDKIPSIMVIHKHVDPAYTRFTTMSGPLANNPFGKMAWSDKNKDLPSSV